MSDVSRLSGEQDRRCLALAAAHQAAEAVTELLRFAREGSDLNGTFGEIEVVEKLMDAAKMSIECLVDDDGAKRFSAIHADIVRELEFWI